jgi:hypothetical protein
MTNEEKLTACLKVGSPDKWLKMLKSRIIKDPTWTEYCLFCNAFGFWDALKEKNACNQCFAGFKYNSKDGGAWCTDYLSDEERVLRAIIKLEDWGMWKDDTETI